MREEQEEGTARGKGSCGSTDRNAGRDNDNDAGADELCDIVWIDWNWN